MTKVIRGDLSGERQKGYESYKTNYGVGPSVTVRRGIPTTEIAAVGTSLAQRQQKNAFYVATSVYSKLTNLEKDFYKRWWVIDKTIDPQYTLEKRILTGRSLAMNRLIRAIVTQGEPYLKPLPFCICAVDIWGNPAPGHELNIECEKLGNYTYKEENNIYGCFTPSSLSAKYEPYHLYFTDHADYCLLTAQQIHEIKTLNIDKNLNFFHKTYDNCWVFNAWRRTIIANFEARGLPLNCYDMRLKIKWTDMFGPAFTKVYFFTLGGPTTYAPMTPNQGGEATLWTRACNEAYVIGGFVLPLHEQAAVYNVEMRIDVVNLPC